MIADRIRAFWKKIPPFVLAGAVLGSLGAVGLHEYLGRGCCTAGASCCHPGASCCHHGTSGGVAQR